jgi:hypothetical protein
VIEQCRQEHPQPGKWLSVGQISFGEGEVFENEPIIPTLYQLAKLVSGVVETLEAYIEGGEGG